MKRYAFLLAAIAALLPASVKAQFKIDDGKVMVGQVPATNNVHFLLGGISRMQWSRYSTLNIAIDGAHPTICSNGRVIRFYNTDNNTYDNVGVKTTFAFMYDTRGSASALSGTLGKVMGLDAGLLSKETAAEVTEVAAVGMSLPTNLRAASPAIGFSAESLQESIPELTVKDENGHTLVDVNSLVPLLVGTLQSLQQQADEQARQIESLTLAGSAKKAQKKQMDLTAVEAAETDANALYAATPNPFRSKVTMNYQVRSSAGDARLTVSDANGKTVFAAAIAERGRGKVKIDGQQWPAGVYVCTLTVDGEAAATQKIIKK